MPNRDQALRILDLRGGMNSADSAFALPEAQCAEAWNVEFDAVQLASRRRGATSLKSLWPHNTRSCLWLFRHLPTADEGAAELWTWDGSDTPQLARLAPGDASFSIITTSDAAAAGNAAYASGASLNGKLFLAYDSSVDRLHVWDGSSVRRCGLAAPGAAPTYTQASGSVTDTRKYRTRVIKKSGSLYDLRSEPSATTAAIAHSAQQGTFTLQSRPTEGETHWELEVASSSSNYAYWYKVGEAAIGATIADNTATFESLSISPEVGQNTTIPSGKYLVVDENRLLVLGSWETASYASRVWWTPRVGASDVGDDERLVNTSAVKSYLDLDRGDGGGITGGIAFDGSVYVFKLSQIYKLQRTNSDKAPYLPHTVSKTVGCINHRTIVQGLDESGEPCIYFWSRTGPYRLGSRGLERMDLDILDYVKRMRFGNPTAVFALWHEAKRQIWFTVSLDGESSSTYRFVFHTQHGRSAPDGVRRGWSIHKLTAGHTCGTMFGATLGNPVSLDLKPYCGLSSGTYFLWRSDADGVSTEPAGNYEARIKTRTYAPGGFDVNVGVTGCQLVARTQASPAALSLRVERDHGAESVSAETTVRDTASADGASAEILDVELPISGAASVAFTVGDSGPINQHWALDALSVRYRVEERR